MSEAAAEYKEPVELFPGVYEFSSLSTIPQNQLIESYGNDFYGRKLLVPNDPDIGRLVQDFEPAIVNGPEELRGDFFGAFDVSFDRGDGSRLAKAIDGMTSIDGLLDRYHRPYDFPNLKQTIFDLNELLGKIGIISQIPVKAHKKRHPEEIMPPIIAAASEIDKKLCEDRLARVKTTGSFIASALASSKRQNHRDGRLWISQGVYKSSEMQVPVAPLGGIAIKSGDFETALEISYKGNPKHGKIEFIGVTEPEKDPVVFGSNGRLYVLQRTEWAQQRLPYKRYAQDEELPERI